MHTPDARPVGETLHPDAALIDAVAMQIDADLFVGRSPVEIARSTVAAIRAALLRDAPVLYVATDANGESRVWGHQPNYDGDFWYAPMTRDHHSLTPPGTVRRAYLVIPEGEETPT